ncbi:MULTISPECIES: Atu4866 domain-containing protein [Catenuloplanes]|uniref:Uncharacterized protein n=1 Tax=Catenuloplanes niger TaxID=587534 RepID=A0AAE3ZII4_9ACTN|nr:Atu4866 domain-containing protein [Catenuloplanes niger]MDR7320584.1 hypothetical protein [Catenuloplanes niger]
MRLRARAATALAALMLTSQACAGHPSEPSGDAVLVKDVRVHGPSGTVVSDVWVVDGRIAATGTAGEVIDGSGLGMVAVVPAPDGTPGHVAGRVAPGIAADLLLVPEPVMPRDGTPWWRVVVGRGDVRMLMHRGRIVVRDGVPLTRPVNADLAGGVWVDRTGWLRQYLLPEGRYDETRGGREHAYTGRYWRDGSRIDYLDDSGFYAFGEFIGDELHHAEYVMRWQPDGSQRPIQMEDGRLHGRVWNHAPDIAFYRFLTFPPASVLSSRFLLATGRKINAMEDVGERPGGAGLPDSGGTGDGSGGAAGA